MNGFFQIRGHWVHQPNAFGEFLTLGDTILLSKKHNACNNRIIFRFENATFNQFIENSFMFIVLNTVSKGLFINFHGMARGWVNH